MTAFLCPQLVGRTGPARALQEVVSAAARGAGSAHVLVGDAGLGKSRLVRETAAAARDGGVLVALGRCVDGPAAPPLRPLTEAVTAVVRGAGVPTAPGVTPYLPVLARLAADLLPAGADAAAPDADPVHLGEGLLRLLAAHGAGRGALLVVEDVHAADSLTLAVLEYVADALAAPGAQLPLSLLLTLRPEPSAGRALATALAARRCAGTTTLAPLSRAEVEQVVRSCAPELPAAVVAVVADRAGGVPFLVEELLSAAADDLGNIRLERVGQIVPYSLADSVRRRTAGLDPAVLELLQLAALVGRTADPALLARVTGAAGPDDVVRTLQPARVAGLLDADEPCTFRHALTRDAVLAEALPGERAAQARRVLPVALAAGADAAVVARVAEAAGDDAAAARAWLDQAQEAVRRGLPSGAEAALEQAQRRARAAADPALEAAVARSRLAALSLAGRADDVLRLCDQLSETAAPASPARRELHLHAARAALETGACERAERELLGCDRDDTRAVALGALVALADDRLADAGERAQRVLDRPDAAAAAVCEAWEVIGRLRRPRDLAGAAAAFAAAHSTARSAGLRLWEVRALHELGTIHMFLSGRPDRLEQAHRAAGELGALTTRAVLDVQIASCCALALDSDAALDRAAAAAAVAEQIGARPLAAAAATSTAMAHAYARRWSEAEEHADRARALSDADPQTGAMLAGLVDGLGGLLAEDRERARRGFDRLAVLAPRAPQMPPTPAQALRVLLATVERRPEAAAGRAAADEAGLATVPYNALLLAYADAVELGRAGGGGPAQQQVEAAEQALLAVDPAGAVQHLRCLGRRLMAEAALQDGWGEPVLWLREAVAHFDVPAPAVADAARELLRRAGVRAPRRGSAPGVPQRLREAGITPREHEVLLLVADGASNREVAARLHLSPRTVETHVARLLDKAAVRTRAQLAGWAADVRGPGPDVRSRP